MSCDYCGYPKRSTSEKFWDFLQSEHFALAVSYVSLTALCAIIILAPNPNSTSTFQNGYQLGFDAGRNILNPQ